jgi:hypothetical protein
LWVRCGGEEGRAPAKPAWSITSESRVDAADAAFVAARSFEHSSEKPKASFAWRHPRDQIRGVEAAIPALVRETSSAAGSSTTPELSERIASRCQVGAQHAAPLQAPSLHEVEPTDLIARCTGEQVEPDRQAPRRGENVRQRILPQERMKSWEEGRERLAPKKREWDAGKEKFKKRVWGTPSEATVKDAWTRRSAKPWKRLEQALKVTDLLLHSGGWGVVVVDLGGISWVEARRIPMHTWFRFRRVVEDSPTILLLLGEEPCAKSCASLVLRCQRAGEKWSAAASRETSFDARWGVTTLQGFEVQGEIACSRMQRLASDAARWQTRMLWNGGF